MNRLPQIAFERGYRATVDGSVLNPKGKVLASSVSSEGYRKFKFDGELPGCLVHRLVAFQKWGEAIFEDGIVVRHLDGNPLNNHPDNLALGTASQNMMDIPVERRLAKAFKATAGMRKHDASTVIAFYRENGWTATMRHFAIKSKGTLSFILNKSAAAKAMLPLPAGSEGDAA